MAQEIWTIRRVLEWTRGYLEKKGDAKARIAAEWLLGNATGLSRVQLYMNYDKPLTKDELSLMHQLIERRALGEPLQYVVGEVPFRHIVIKCEHGVLIPRPETEVLVDKVLEWLEHEQPAGAAPAVPVPPTDAAAPTADATPTGATAPTDAAAPTAGATPTDASDLSIQVLDLCTGSGCIALSLACENQNVHVSATDISPAAIALAQRNAQALALEERAQFIECDLASGIDEKLMGKFSVVVSNPPYIPSSLVKQLPAEVSDFEPHLALDGGADGLDIFRRILELAPTLLAPGGLLACELFEDSLEEAKGLVLAQEGWKGAEVYADLAGRPRILCATRTTQE